MLLEIQNFNTTKIRRERPSTFLLAPTGVPDIMMLHYWFSSNSNFLRFYSGPHYRATIVAPNSCYIMQLKATHTMHAIQATINQAQQWNKQCTWAIGHLLSAILKIVIRIFVIIRVIISNFLELIKGFKLTTISIAGKKPIGSKG